MPSRSPYPLRFRFILTPLGAAVLVIALAGLVRALLNRNAYEIVLAAATLLLLLVLGITGGWKSKKLISMEPGWKTPFPMTACMNEDTLVTGLVSGIPLFFRQHFSVYGFFLPGGSKAGLKKGCSVLIETSVPQGDDTASMLVDFPMSGIFHGNGLCKLRDIFGLFSFCCGLPQQRTVNVRCTPCIGKKTNINAQTGAEDQRNKPSSDVERYYQREYTPGDRFRDINWKSSEKIDALITRISTDNQEKVSRIEVHFRNYRAGVKIKKAGDMSMRAAIEDQPSLYELWLLDRAKARLSYFLRSLMEQNSSFIFDVRSAGASWEIQDMDDLDEFCEELAAVSFFPARHETGMETGKGDLYVFSTACDSGLPAFLLANSIRPVTLFIVQPEESKPTSVKTHRLIKLFSKPKETEADIEILRLTDFDLKGTTSDIKWLGKNNIKPLGVQAAKTEVFYAGIRI